MYYNTKVLLEQLEEAINDTPTGDRAEIDQRLGRDRALMRMSKRTIEALLKEN